MSEVGSQTASMTSVSINPPPDFSEAVPRDCKETQNVALVTNGRR
jgi:hypothetical protein